MIGRGGNKKKNVNVFGFFRNIEILIFLRESGLPSIFRLDELFLSPADLLVSGNLISLEKIEKLFPEFSDEFKKKMEYTARHSPQFVTKIFSITQTHFRGKFGANLGRTSFQDFFFFYLKNFK